MKQVAFHRSRGSRVLTDYFFVDDSVEDVKKAFRSAAVQFLQTAEGREASKHSFFEFNWGDALSIVPEEFLERHGIYLYRSKVHVYVKQDEILFPEVQMLYSQEE